MSKVIKCTNCSFRGVSHHFYLDMDAYIKEHKRVPLCHSCFDASKTKHTKA